VAITFKNIAVARGYRDRVSPRSRVVATTAASAAIAALLVVGVVLLQTGPTPGTAAGPQRRPGPPPLTLALGVRTDREAQALRRAAAAYDAGRRAQAAREFARWRSVEARVGEAFALWPGATVDRLNRLAGLHADRAVVQLNLGVALYWSGLAGAQEAWRAAIADEPDTAYAVAAANLLHPEYAPGVPVFVSTAPLPPGFDELSPPAQLHALQRGASGSVAGKLLYGSALQRLGRTRSAVQVFAAAAREAPGNVEAQVANAVGRFDKSRPADAFSRLGPLTRTFPNKATVRFHLGLLLLWSGETREAKRQLQRAIAVEPRSPLAGQARQYLAELHKAGV
jgi:tetratricopeptide (TPR) repeat protein